MSLVLNPYLHVADGRAEEALNFYRSVFGGELEIMRFTDVPGMEPGADHKGTVMHGALITPALQLFCADSAPEDAPASSSTMSIALSGDDKPTLTQYYNALVEGGTVGEPLMEAPWGDTFGMLVDKFGVHWMVNITASAS